MGKQPHYQPNEESQSTLPAALCRWRDILATAIRLLRDFGNRKRLTAETLQEYIDLLNGIAIEVSDYTGKSSRSERKRLSALLRPILAAIRNLDKAREAYLRGNDYLRYIDQALLDLLTASSECINL